MKIYFNAALTGKQKYKDNYKEIIESLEKEGHTVIKSHIMNRNLHEVESQDNKEQHIDNLHARKMIQDSDCMVVEGSQPSLGVGYLLTVALEMKKPILVLFSKKVHGIISGIPNRLITVKKYNVKNGKLSSTIRGFIASAIEKNEFTRFNFQLTKEMDCFLYDESKEKSISKADYLRTIILEKMNE